MANGGLQSVGFFVGYIALSLIIVAVVLPFWKMNDLSNEVMIHSLCESSRTAVNPRRNRLYVKMSENSDSRSRKN